MEDFVCSKWDWGKKKWLLNEEVNINKYYLFFSDTTVHLGSESGPEGKVQGLDDQGYLLVKTLDGTIHTLQPDGNSFDIMRNLIAIKSQ